MTTKSTSRLTRTDGMALAIIALAYALAILAMSPSRDFALLDDWTYANSVQHIVAGQGFVPSQYAQATLVSHSYWGAAFAWLLGMNFTALTLATMTMSIVGAMAFYLILRVLDFTPAFSGLGVAVLTLNPFYLYLSYTYMTEITFTALVLVACLCYLLGVRGEGSLVWLLFGSLFALLAFLTRQFGLAIPVAALLWLATARKLTLPRALAVAGLPLLSAIVYYTWSAGFGPTFSSSVGREELLELLHPAEWAQRASRFVYFAVFLPGLTVPLWSKPRRWRTALGLSLATAIVVYVLWQVKMGLVDTGQSDLNELSYTWLSYVFTNTAILTLIYCLGAGLAVWLFYTMFERAWPTVRDLVRRRVVPSPALFFLLAGGILFVGTYLVSAGFLDRYWVPILPFVIAGALYTLKGRSWRSLIPSLVALAIVGTYGALVHLDDYAAMGARWTAGRDLLASGVSLDTIENGYAWDGFFLGESSMARYPDPDVRVIGRIFPPYELIDPQYVIDTQPRAGYTVVKQYPYSSILGGMAEREMLVMSDK
ncbi:MAG TPA: hypothetical protein VLQ48_06300 [Chloroflexia bacterium]|nr:hypothetical protein [Chloroflexia bacterium]